MQASPDGASSRSQDAQTTAREFTQNSIEAKSPDQELQSVVPKVSQRPRVRTRSNVIQGATKHVMNSTALGIADGVKDPQHPTRAQNQSV